MKVEQIINSVFLSNTYILYKEDSKDVWLIDIGDADKVISYLRFYNKKLKGVFITHTHFDHIYGLNDLINYSLDTIVYTSSNGKEGLFSNKLNLSLYNESNYTYKFTHNIIELQEGSNIQIFSDIFLTVWDTPGHDWSCLTYKFDNGIFTGDSFIPGRKVISKFPKGNKLQANLSYNRILNNSKGLTIYPGHGNVQYIN